MCPWACLSNTEIYLAKSISNICFIKKIETQKGIRILIYIYSDVFKVNDSSLVTSCPECHVIIQQWACHLRMNDIQLFGLFLQIVNVPTSSFVLIQCKTSFLFNLQNEFHEIRVYFSYFELHIIYIYKNDIREN